jgi:hypothetical protein
MRRTHFGTIVFVLLICLIGAVGYSRGWFHLASSEDTTRDEVHVNLTVDRGKFRSDSEKAVDKTKQEASKVSDSIRRGSSDLKDRLHDKSAPSQN